MTKEHGAPPIMSQLHFSTAFMSLRILSAPHRAAAASIAAELGMSMPDPAEFARQHALCSSTYQRAAPAVAEALLVLGHAESSLEFTGELVRMRASKHMPCTSVRLDVLTSLCWGLARHGIMAGGPQYTFIHTAPHHRLRGNQAPRANRSTVGALDRA